MVNWKGRGAHARLLARLATEVCTLAHRRALVGALGDVLSSELGVSQLQLLVPKLGADGSGMTLLWRPGSSVKESSHADVSAALADATDGTRCQITVPVPMRVCSAQLVLEFAGSDPPAVATEKDLLAALGAVVALACHVCDLVT